MISVRDWITDPSLSESTRHQRRLVLAQFCKANGRLPNATFDKKGNSGRSAVSLEEVVGAVESILEDVKSGKVTIYQTARIFVTWLIERKKAPWTIAQWRIALPPFFESTLGEDNVKRRVYDRLVPKVKAYNTTQKKPPSVDGLRHMLEIATPMYRCLIALLACTGMRINEALSRKLSQIDRRPSGIGRIKLRASETKAKIDRFVFIPKETLKWIDEFHAQMKMSKIANPNDWIFPGEKHNHLSSTTAESKIKQYFKLSGMLDKEGDIYTSHSFRTFADSRMSKAGLDRKWIELIISHKSKLGASASYKDWEQIEEDWQELCEKEMTWFRPTEVIKEIVDPEARRQLDNIRKMLLVLGLQEAQIKQIEEGQFPELEDRETPRLQDKSESEKQ